MEAKKVKMIRKSTHDKHMFAKDKEIHSLKGIIEQSRLDSLRYREIVRKRDDEKQSYDTSLCLIQKELESFRYTLHEAQRYMCECYRLLQEFINMKK